MAQTPGEDRAGEAEGEDVAGHLRMTDEQLQDGLTPSEAAAAQAAGRDPDDRPPTGDDGP
jgi:hypothetical protein